MHATERVRDIRITGAAEHNLKHINVTIPRQAVTVVTGLSGSGKSSLAFDTLYAEGQRRYVESLSAYARQFLDQMHKPHVEQIEGLSPAISIEQKTISRNPRSTVGTVTEIHDYLRVLFATIGLPHCPQCGHPLQSQTIDQIVEIVMDWNLGSRLIVMAPVVRGRKGHYRQLFEQFAREGYSRVKIDGRIRSLEEPIKLNRNYKHDISLVIDRIVLTGKVRQRLSESIETALRHADGLVTLEQVDRPGNVKGSTTFSQSMACPEHGPQIVELSPRMFSFNSPYGACPDCGGVGTRQEIDPDRIVPNPELSIREGAVAPWAHAFRNGGGTSSSHKADDIMSVLDAHKIDPDRPWRRLSRAKRDLILYGSGEDDFGFEGVIPHLERRVAQTDSERIQNHYRRYYSDAACSTCAGSRLRPESLAVTVKGLNIAEFSALSIQQALDFLATAQWDRRERAIGAQAVHQIIDRLNFMANVGLDYLTLDRPTATISGGEAQRIRLATQVGSRLIGVLYILDEPSIGLHHRDNHRLLAMLRRLRDLGNTLVIVEHDEPTIRQADHVIDLGPGAGRLGGTLVAAGSPEQIERVEGSLTGDYLSGRRVIPIPGRRRRPHGNQILRVIGANEHNLNRIDVAFPLGVMICVTGVSGSGKSTLVSDILHRRLARHFFNASTRPGTHEAIEGVDLLDKVVAVDQSPIGRTPRSNPATYTGLYSPIRALFAATPEARVRGYKPGRFSFNVSGGRCETCKGAGLIKVEMHFLPDVYVECEICGGRRFNRATLDIRYKGKSIADVLEMSALQALEFFESVPSLRQRLSTLCDVGLGYIHLGQSATTLSGGEAQRIKLSRELGKRSTGRTLYILDEPTTGLHFEDVRHLLEVLNRLVDQGNTVVLIEHNMEVIKSADWLIDLGPEGGDEGGRVVATGTPETVAATPGSHTGAALAAILSRHHSCPKPRTGQPR